MSTRNGDEQIEFGDFQTPLELANRCCEVVRDRFGIADTVVEPTCGEGAFAVAAVNILRPRRVLAYEIHLPYVKTAKQRVQSLLDCKCEVLSTGAEHHRGAAVPMHVDAEVSFHFGPPWLGQAQGYWSYLA